MIEKPVFRWGVAIELVWRTCGTRDERPSSNLGRGKQGKAIRVDCTDPQDDSGSGVTRQQHTRHIERESMSSVRLLERQRQILRKGGIGGTGC